MQTPSTTNWVVPERADLLMVLNANVSANADGPVTADAQPDDPNPNPLSDPPLRSQLLVDQMVRKVRAAIRNAGHTPLSVEPNAVPPEAFDRVIYMAAHRLLISTANIQRVVMSEHGVYAPIMSAAKEAEEWVDGRLEGGRRIGGIATHAITPPDDPTGRDWKTAATFPADVADWTPEELAGMDWTWEGMAAMGYTQAEWAALTNPPIRGTVRVGSTLPPQNMTLQTPGWVASSVREQLGTL